MCFRAHEIWYFLFSFSFCVLPHFHQLSDDASSDVGKALRGFREGDKVKTVILSLDADAKKISFGIKPSYFDDEDFEGSDDDEDEEEEGSDVEMVDGEDSDDGETTLKFLTGDESDEDEDEEEEEDEDDEETVSLCLWFLCLRLYNPST